MQNFRVFGGKKIKISWSTCQRIARLATVSYPDPAFEGGKRSGELGQNPWACTEEFPHANQIIALAQSHMIS